MNLTLAQLEYVVALDSHRHYVKAAEHCFVTQPTLSMQIKKLESQLGIVLFDRSKQPLVPTEAGEAIIAQARVILMETRKVKDILQDYQETLSGELRLGIIPTLAPYLLPRFISTLIKDYPEVNLKVQEMMTERVVEALKKDRIDAGILVTPLHESGIEEEPLFYEEFHLYVGPNYPGRARPMITLQEALKNRLWLLTEGNCFRNQTVNLCAMQQMGATAGFDFESGSLETLRKIVDAEGGATLLPELASMDLSEELADRVRNIASPNPVREVSLVYSRNYAKRRLIRLISEQIKGAVPRSMQQAGNRAVIEWR